MAEIFQSFIGGVGAGTELRQNRERRNALQEAGRLYSENNYEGAENALLAAGMPDAAASYTALGEARRGRNTRQAAQDAVAALPEGATPEQQMQAASGAYMGAGDFEQGGQLYNAYAEMNEHQRNQVRDNFQYLGQQTQQLRGLPVEQRSQAAIAAIEGTPFDTPQLRARIQELDGADGITDADLDGFEQSLLTAQEQIGLRREDARIAEDTRRWNATYAQNDRQIAIQARNSAPDTQRPLPPQALATARSQLGSATRLRQSYDTFITMLQNATPQALAGVGPDGAALQAAHRLLSIQAKSPAALDLGALVGADFNILNDILGEPGNISQLVRQGGRDGALRRLQPFDQFLTAGADAMRTTYQPWASQMPDIYGATPTPDAAGDPPPAPNGVRRVATPEQEQELVRNLNNPAAIQSYNATFGEGAAERAIASQALRGRQNQQPARR